MFQTTNQMMIHRVIPIQSRSSDSQLLSINPTAGLITHRQEDSKKKHYFCRGLHNFAHLLQDPHLTTNPVVNGTDTENYCSYHQIWQEMAVSWKISHPVIGNWLVPRSYQRCREASGKCWTWELWISMDWFEGIISRGNWGNHNNS